MKAKDVQEWIKPAVQITVAGFGIFALYKLGQKFGIFQTAEEAATEKVTTQASASAATVDDKNAFLAFNPKYWNALAHAYQKKFNKKLDVNKQYSPYNTKDLEYLAKNILDSKGTFKDDNDVLYNVFRKIQSQFQLSLISSIFSSKYNKDLLNYIQPVTGFTNDKQFKTIIQIVKNLPQYK